MHFGARRSHRITAEPDCPEHAIGERIGC